MRLFQFVDDDGTSAVGVCVHEAGPAVRLQGYESVYALASDALARRASLESCIRAARTSQAVDVAMLLAARRVRAPIYHPDPARCIVSGTGLTHRDSAATRDQMSHTATGGHARESDSMRMYASGVEGGRPAAGVLGVEPEWFYKGDGSCLVAPGEPLVKPHFAEDAGEEPEVGGVYIIGADGIAYRIGFVMANDFSDHCLEQRNYLYVASSKLRPCAVSPQLLVGELPSSVHGTSRIYRDDQVIWEGRIRTGEAQMCHSIRNLEGHHFKHRPFRRPGDLHVHLFGTSVMSYSDGLRKRAGDIFEIDVPVFGPALRNTLVYEPAQAVTGCRVL